MSASAAVVTVLYPSHHTFDLSYYLTTHMPLVSRHWGPHGMTGWKVLQISSPDSVYQIQATLEFASGDAIQKAMSSDGRREVMGDIKNFTEAQPVIIAGPVVGSG
nr:hypothetical protein CFP56_71705 [Quercus suber]